MLSICIPVFNYDVRSFINSIHSQVTQAKIDFEIVIVDDCSNQEYERKNRELESLVGVNYQVLDSNLGRSKIRNYLVSVAKYENLLFCDCDSMTEDDSFIVAYLSCVDKGYEVVYGGRSYQNQFAVDERLRWAYGKAREEVSAAHRSKTPYKSFLSNNFLIKKSVFAENPLDESISTYGYEDSLFAHVLRKKGIQIRHIDNPLIHLQLEGAEVFIKKSHQALENLNVLSQDLKKEDLEVKLLKYYKLLSKIGLLNVFKQYYGWRKAHWLKNLHGKSPNLFIFDLYRLGYFSALD